MADEFDRNPEEAEGQAPQEKKTGGNKVIIIGIIAGVIIIEALMLFVFFQITKPPNQAKVEEKMRADSLRQAQSDQTSIGIISDPPIEVIVNIADTDGSRFLKAVIVLEYDKKYTKLGPELILRHAKLKDMLIEQLSAMTLEELNESDIRAHIRNEFLRNVNLTIPEKLGQISNVFINEFIIQ
ncbi:MAG: flagellar basal body-associated FliL family protein [Chitinispirillia bacterium]|jgi:flagellar basal body-associated protein FliL